MKIFHRYLFLSLIISVLVGCSAAPPAKEEPSPPEEQITDSVPKAVKEPDVSAKESEPPVKQKIVEPAVVLEPAKPVEPQPSVKEEKAPVIKKQEPVVEAKPDTSEEKNTVIAEFEGVTITKETYDQTKTEMEKIVEQLNRITAAKDYTQWITFLSDDYKQQYSKPSTLKAVSEALPVKGIKLKSLKDYFMYVFVPSRQNVRVDDINFVSPSRVEVIMKQGNVSLLVYGLENIDGNWKLIPPKL